MPVTDSASSIYPVKYVMPLYSTSPGSPELKPPELEPSTDEPPVVVLDAPLSHKVRIPERTDLC